ncbi:Photosystem I reaction center subunit N, chloroplastic, partial [Linum grandiflorum]
FTNRKPSKSPKTLSNPPSSSSFNNSAALHTPQKPPQEKASDSPSMAATSMMMSSSSSVLACKCTTKSSSTRKFPVIRAQQGDREAAAGNGKKAAVAFLAATLFASATVSSSFSANAGVIDEYLEKSKVNKELNDQKRLATSGANFARAYTVQFGSCKFPENFTGCQDLAKQKFHSSLRIWTWSAKEKTSTSVALMSSGNGDFKL